MLTSAVSYKSGSMSIFNKIDTEGIMQICLSWNLHDHLCKVFFIEYLKSFKGKFCYMLPYFPITFCV